MLREERAASSAAVAIMDIYNGLARMACGLDAPALREVIVKPVVAVRAIIRPGLVSKLLRFLLLRGDVPVILRMRNGKRIKVELALGQWFQVKGGVRDITFADEGWARGYIMHRARG